MAQFSIFKTRVIHFGVNKKIITSERFLLQKGHNNELKEKTSKLTNLDACNAVIYGKRVKSMISSKVFPPWHKFKLSEFLALL